MSLFGMENLSRLAPLEPPVADPPALPVCPRAADSFHDYLQRAQAQPAEPQSGSTDPPPPAAPARQPDVVPAEKPTKEPVGPRAQGEEQPHGQETAQAPAQHAEGDQPPPAAGPRENQAKDLPETPSQPGEGGQRRPQAADKGKAKELGERQTDKDQVVLTAEAQAAAATVASPHTAHAVKTENQAAGTAAEVPGDKAEAKAESAAAVVAETIQATGPVVLPKTAVQAEKAAPSTFAKKEKAAAGNSNHEVAPSPSGKKATSQTAPPAARQEAKPAARPAATAEAEAAQPPAGPPTVVAQSEHVEAPRRPRTAVKTEAAVERTGDETAPRSGQPVVENSLLLRQKAEQTTLAAEKTLTTATAADAGDKAAQPGAPGGSEALANAPMRIATDARSRPNSAAARAVDTGPVDRARLVQRVERAFQAMSDRGGSIRLRLSPPELGSLKVEITVRDGTMTARLETETHAAKNLLLDNLPALRERLAQQDIKVQQFDVELMDRSPGGTPDQSAYSAGSFAGGGGGGGAGRMPAQPAPEANIAAPGPAPAGRPGEASQLNVVV